jgi:hypothetical protein
VGLPPAPFIYAFLADTSAPCVQDDVRYPVQPWTLARTNPAALSISRSDRSPVAPAIQSDQEPLLATSSGVTCGSNRMSAIWKRPPGFKTRKTSPTTLGFSGQRLNTPLEITRSTDASGKGSDSVAVHSLGVVNSE